ASSSPASTPASWGPATNRSSTPPRVTNSTRARSRPSAWSPSPWSRPSPPTASPTVGPSSTSAAPSPAPPPPAPPPPPTHTTPASHSLSLLATSTAPTADNPHTEPASVREPYTKHTAGRRFLTAPRLVESGVPSLTVVCGDHTPAPPAAWDTHGDNSNRLKN